jgi:hypothetical protein
MTRPLAWMAAVRDHPNRPAAKQCHVLDRLALRMDWQTGCGAVSAAQLAADADCDERTVRRATTWGRDHDMLLRTRRGHRIDAERVMASEWRLTLPGQQDTGVRLASNSTGHRSPVGTDPTGQNPGPNRTKPRTQPDSTTPPSRTRSSRPSPSARGDGARAPRPPRASSPPWCGKCDERTRIRELDDGRPARCPVCHPIAVAAGAAS